MRKVAHRETSSTMISRWVVAGSSHPARLVVSFGDSPLGRIPIAGAVMPSDTRGGLSPASLQRASVRKNPKDFLLSKVTGAKLR